MPFLCLIILFTFLTGQAAAPSPPQVNPSLQVDKLFERWDRTTSPGCALAVMKDGRIVYKRGYGMADLDHDVTITPATVFHVASVSKQFTAASILLLEQDGKLSIDDDVRKYMPELTDFGEKITLRHLLHHMSGLRDQWDLLGLAGWRYSLDLITDDDVLSLVVRQKELNFKPGDRYLYCNTGYTLLAQVVARVSGQSLRDFTAARIFEPLGMKSTHFRDDHAEIVKGMAYGYVPAGATFKLSVTNFDTVGATSLLTTVEDLALWDENFYNPRVGGKRLIDRMLERDILNNGETIDYARGLSHGKYKGLDIVDHAGSDAGYRSDLLRFPGQHFSVAILCNLSINPSQLTRQVADIYLAKELRPEAEKSEEPAVKLTAEQLGGKTGIYINPDGDIIRRIVLDEGILRSRGSGASLGVELKPLSDTRFKPTGQPVEFRFEPSGAKGMRLIETPSGGAKPAVFVRGEEFKPTPEQLADYVGRYQSDEIEPVYSLAVHDGRLTLERLKLRPSQLEPAFKDLFASPLGNIRFTRDAQRRVTGFILNRGRILNFRFKKIGTLTVDRQRPPLEFGTFRAPELVDLSALDSSLRLDIRYATKNNFLGRQVYPEARAFLQRPAAEALVRVQRALKDRGYGLIVFDGYRPWAVTKLFWDSTAPEKRNFVADPAEGSKHNRGCAVDLSMVDLATGREVEMPSAFDEMSERSAANYAGGTPAQRERRDLLRRAMEKEGFQVYPDEWWHFDYLDWKQYRILDIAFKNIASAPEAPDIELVESIPVGTSLDNPEIRDTREVWLEMIGAARKTLDIEQFYISSEPGKMLEDVLSAIVSAAGRGVKVRVLVDARMSKTYPESIERLLNIRNIEARRIDFGAIAGGPQHAKYFIVDGQEVFVGSQNFDWRALEHIHELGLRIDDSQIAAAYGDIFNLDWQLATLSPEEAKAFPLTKKSYRTPILVKDAAGETAVLFPTFSPAGYIPDSALWDEKAIVELIDGARQSLSLQFLSYSPAERQGGRYAAIDDALRRAAKRGVKVRMIISDWEKGTPAVAALKELAALTNTEVAFTAIPDWSGGYIPYARIEHCKYIVADRARFWLGTGNCEKNYYYGSRNLGIAGTSPNLAGALSKIFLKSWTSPYKELITQTGEYAPREHGERKAT